MFVIRCRNVRLVSTEDNETKRSFETNKVSKKIKRGIFLKNETLQIFKIERFFEKLDENEKEKVFKIERFFEQQNENEKERVLKIERFF